MFLLLFWSPSVEWVYDNPDHGGFSAECASIFTVGMPDKSFSGGSSRPADGVVSFDGGERMERAEAVEACSNRRTFHVAGMALLAVPASSLCVVAFTRRPE